MTRRARPARFAGVTLPLIVFSAAAALVLAQGVRENVQVGLVSIRVDVRDKDGKAIPDLAPTDVRLRVDGKDVPIEGLDRVTAPSVAVAAPMKPKEAPPVQANDPMVAAAPPPAAASSDLYLAILVDETASNSYDRREVYRQIELFLGRGGSSTHVMLQRFDGRLQTECPWTTNLDEALAAAKKMGKRMQDSRMPSPSQLREEIRKGRKARDIQMQIDLYARRSFDAILQALVRFPDVPGRRGLVVVTDGTPLISPFDLTMMFSDNDANGRDERQMRADRLKSAPAATEDMKFWASQIEHTLQDQAVAAFSDAGAGQNTSWPTLMAQLTSKALELDIAFYPIDSEDPDRGTNPEVGSKWPGRSMPGVVMGTSSVPVAGTGMTARIAVVETMSGLADLTGGQAILVPRKAADGLSDIASRPPSEYMVSFTDPFPADRRFHKLEITLVRSGARAVYRKGYRVRSDEERIVDAIVAHLEEAPKGRNPLGAVAALDVLREEPGRKIVEMKIEYSPVEAPGDVAAERDLDVWAVCTDDAGNRAKPIHRQVRAVRQPPGSRTTYKDSFQLALPPGPYTWSLALKDRPTGAVSYVVVKKTV